jgi:hypothetical protein
MYYLPGYRVYQVDTRVAPTGEARKTFWGMNRETFLADEIDLPESVNNFVVPLISDDKDRAAGKEGVNIENLQHTNIYLAFGDIELIKHLYPELRVHIHGTIESDLNRLLLQNDQQV